MTKLQEKIESAEKQDFKVYAADELKDLEFNFIYPKNEWSKNCFSSCDKGCFAYRINDIKQDIEPICLNKKCMAHKKRVYTTKINRKRRLKQKLYESTIIDTYGDLFFNNELTSNKALVCIIATILYETIDKDVIYNVYQDFHWTCSKRKFYEMRSNLIKNLSKLSNQDLQFLLLTLIVRLLGFQHLKLIFSIYGHNIKLDEEEIQCL